MNRRNQKLKSKIVAQDTKDSLQTLMNTSDPRSTTGAVQMTLARQALLDNFDAKKNYTLSMKIFGTPITMQLGLSEQKIIRLQKMYPSLYKTSKKKSYDISLYPYGSSDDEGASLDAFKAGLA